MMFYKNAYLALTMILMIISLAFVNALVERLEEEYEENKRLMKIEYERLTLTSGEVESYTAMEYAKGLILNWDETEFRTLNEHLLPYYYKVARNMVPGPNMLSREEFCQKDNSCIPFKKLLRCKKANLEALEGFSDDKQEAIKYARNSTQLGKLDAVKQKDIIAYLKHIADNITFKKEIEDPHTYCKYIPKMDTYDSGELMYDDEIEFKNQHENANDYNAEHIIENPIYNAFDDEITQSMRELKINRTNERQGEYLKHRLNRSSPIDEDDRMDHRTYQNAHFSGVSRTMF